MQNFRIIKVSFLSPTNYTGSRIKIYETKRFNDEKTQSKIFSYDYKFGNSLEQALEILKNNGFNIIGTGSEFNNYYIICDNWGEDFKQIKDLK